MVSLSRQTVVWWLARGLCGAMGWGDMVCTRAISDMTYFPDLSPYEYCGKSNDEAIPTVNVGWLDY